MLSTSEFNKDSNKSSGLQSRCKTCQRTYKREHYENNKTKYIEKARRNRINHANWWKDFKRKLVCSKCGENHPACLDFHHLRDKEANIAMMVSAVSRKRLLEEIDR